MPIPIEAHCYKAGGHLLTVMAGRHQSTPLPSSLIERTRAQIEICAALIEPAREWQCHGTFSWCENPRQLKTFPAHTCAAADPCRRGARRPAGRYHTYPGASAAGSPPLPPRVAAAAALPLRAPTWAHLRSQLVHMHVPRTGIPLALCCYGLPLLRRRRLLCPHHHHRKGNETHQPFWRPSVSTTRSNVCTRTR